MGVGTEVEMTGGGGGVHAVVIDVIGTGEFCPVCDPRAEDPATWKEQSSSCEPQFFGKGFYTLKLSQVIGSCWVFKG